MAFCLLLFLLSSQTRISNVTNLARLKLDAGKLIWDIAKLDGAEVAYRLDKKVLFWNPGVDADRLIVK